MPRFAPAGDRIGPTDGQAYLLSAYVKVRMVLG